jgi:hypothetical protein
MYKLQEKPLALRREHPALQNMLLFPCLWVIFALLDPDRRSGYGFRDPLRPDPIRSDPDPQHWYLLGSGYSYEGVANYIFSFLPQNTETPQLWAELEAASGPEYPVEAVMKTWTEQKGFPVITVQSKQVIILLISFALFADFLKSR